MHRPERYTLLLYMHPEYNSQNIKGNLRQEPRWIV